MISWIKIETTLPQKPEIRKLALRLKGSPEEAIGLCVVFWAWLDVNSVDGNLKDMDEAFIDAIVGRPGFAVAMCAVGWLATTPRGFLVANFERHNGTNSKRRALNARRQSSFRRRHTGNSHDQ